MLAASSWDVASIEAMSVRAPCFIVANFAATIARCDSFRCRLNGKLLEIGSPLARDPFAF